MTKCRSNGSCYGGCHSFDKYWLDRQDYLRRNITHCRVHAATFRLVSSSSGFSATFFSLRRLWCFWIFWWYAFWGGLHYRPWAEHIVLQCIPATWLGFWFTSFLRVSDLENAKTSAHSTIFSKSQGMCSLINTASSGEHACNNWPRKINSRNPSNVSSIFDKEIHCASQCSSRQIHCGAFSSTPCRPP